MPMNKLRYVVGITLAMILATGCSSTDDRLIRHVAESNRQQAEQNREMAKLHQEVAEGTSRLVDAVAASREEMLDMEHELQDQRTKLDAERRSLANERHRESILAPVLSNVGLMMVAALPLVLCWYLLHGLRSQSEEVSEVVIEQLVRQTPELLGTANDDQRAIEHRRRPARHEVPPF